MIGREDIEGVSAARRRNGRDRISFSTSVIIDKAISLSSTRRTSIVKGRV